MFWKRKRGAAQRGQTKHKTILDCNEKNASLFSRAFFCWVTPLLTHGWSTPVELDTLPDIGIGSEMDSGVIAARFHTEWAKEIRRASSGNDSRSRGQSRTLRALRQITQLPRVLSRFGTLIFSCFRSPSKSSSKHRSDRPSLVCALYPLASGYLARALIARLVTELIPVFIPILVKLTTSYAHHRHSTIKHALKAAEAAAAATAATGRGGGLGNNSGLPSLSTSAVASWHGYALALGMFAMLLLYSWSFQWFFFEVGKATIVVRSALISAMFRKSLVLSSQARSRLTVGQLTNLVSSDIGQIERGIANMLVCLTVPVQVVASIIVLIYMIGPTGIVGWFLVVAFVPVQMWASRYLVRIRGKAIKHTDKRIQATREALQGIRVVKFFVWENTMLETIQRIRSKELRLVARLNLVRYGLMSFALHSPVFASVLTFAIYALVGGKLKTGPVFAVIGIFNSMSVPLSWLPGALTETRNTLVPLRRITDALLEEELDELPPSQSNLDMAVRINNGSFSWKSTLMTSSSDANIISGSKQKSDVSLQIYRFPDEPSVDQAREDTLNSLSLASISLEIPHGCLVAVIGSVGSGKSTLINALIGEMKQISGTMELSGTIGYAPQVPWVMNSTIRENILFGLPFDRDKYINVLEACALDVDLAALPAGDLTEIGERGVTLSGGQKQRVSIARTAYSESSIMLLDDCLSAVDTRVSNTIFKHCIKGFMAGKTRVVVTNNLDYLSAVDIVITMSQGRIVEQGTFANLMALEGTTTAMITSLTNSQQADHCNAVIAPYTTDSSLHTATPIKGSSPSPSVVYTPERGNMSRREKKFGAASAALASTDAATSTFDMSQTSAGSGESSISGSHESDMYFRDKNVVLTDLSKTPRLRRGTVQKLMSEEERATGQISLSTYNAYIQAGGGYVLLAGIILCLAISQACRVGSDFWMRLWIRHRRETSATHTYIWVYALLGGMQFIWFCLFALLLVVTVYKSSKWFHQRALQRVLCSPMSFFDTTPLGRILNRFTRDIDSLDLALCDFFRQFYQNISRSIGSFVSIAILIPIFFAPLVPLFALSWALIYFYLRTSVEVQRVAAISRSPLYAHYTEMLQGLSTIRAFDAQIRFISKAEKTLDNANKPQWYSMVIQNWIWLRVDYLSHILTLIVCLIVVAQPERWDAAAVGLLLVQATQMGAYATYAGRGWTELQNNMNSVERISHYAKALQQELDQPEDQNQDAASQAPSAWPERGTIIIRDLSLQYRKGLPLALKGISMEVYDGEKIGIVGRSGAGKSSIVSALFRLVEPCGGRIFVDGVDTQTVPLSRLRRAVGILPQDPVLFDGTIRDNVDPFHEFSDTEIWSVLEQVCLHSTVLLRSEKLESLVGEGGESLSVGQRQLLCLARVLLREPKILVLDEATANVDLETDAAIQNVVLSRARDMTVISIAHRLQTIASYDRVFVMDDGQVVESGAPLALLDSLHQDKPSVFYAMAKEMGDEALDHMLAQARHAEQKRRYS
ncbi:hypothetical protein IWW45_003763 [Coemansia sp. RSA 485]|nr:hypothetical protein IWW45_003763 [Coemansia sp. RSA 485]